MAKVTVVHDFMGVAALFRAYKHEVILDDIHSDTDLVVFTGGEDVNPALYGEEPLRETYYTDNRDSYEIEKYREAVAKDKGIAGICRGAQLLTVMKGAKLIQHVPGHWGGHHIVKDIQGNEYRVNSIHHQQMYVPKDAFLVSWCYSSLMGYTWSEESGRTAVDVSRNVECWAIRGKMLAFQAHPELRDPSTCTYYFFKYLRDYVGIMTEDMECAD